MSVLIQKLESDKKINLVCYIKKLVIRNCRYTFEHNWAQRVQRLFSDYKNANFIKLRDGEKEFIPI